MLSKMKRLRQREDENARLKRILVDRQIATASQRWSRIEFAVKRDLPFLPDGREREHLN